MTDTQSAESDIFPSLSTIPGITARSETRSRHSPLSMPSWPCCMPMTPPIWQRNSTTATRPDHAINSARETSSSSPSSYTAESSWAHKRELQSSDYCSDGVSRSVSLKLRHIEPSLVLHRVIPLCWNDQVFRLGVLFGFVSCLLNRLRIVDRFHEVPEKTRWTFSLMLDRQPGSPDQMWGAYAEATSSHFLRSHRA